MSKLDKFRGRVRIDTLEFQELLGIALDLERSEKNETAAAFEWKKRHEGLEILYKSAIEGHDRRLNEDHAVRNDLLNRLDVVIAERDGFKGQAERAEIDRKYHSDECAVRIKRAETERDQARTDLQVAQEDRAGLRENLEAADDKLRQARGLVEAFLLDNPEGSLNDAIRTLGNAYRAKRDLCEILSKTLEETRKGRDVYAERQKELEAEVNVLRVDRKEHRAATEAIDEALPDNVEPNLEEKTKLLVALYRDAREHALELTKEALDDPEGSRSTLLARISDLRKAIAQTDKILHDSIGEGWIRVVAKIRPILLRALDPARPRLMTAEDLQASASLEAPGSPSQDLRLAELILAKRQLQESNQQRNLMARRVDEADAARERIKAELAHACAERDELQALVDKIEAQRAEERRHPPLISTVLDGKTYVRTDDFGALVEKMIERIKASPFDAPMLPPKNNVEFLAKRLFLAYKERDELQTQKAVDADIKRSQGALLTERREEIQKLKAELASMWGHDIAEDLKTLRAKVSGLELQRDSAEKATQVIAREHAIAVEALTEAQERIRLLVRDREEISRQVHHGPELQQRRKEVEELREEVRNWKREAEGKTQQLEGYRELFAAVRRMRKGGA